MRIKILFTLIFAAIFGFQGLPAYALQASADGIQYVQSGAVAGVYSTGNAEVPVDVTSASAAATALISVTLTSNVVATDTLTFNLGLSKPVASTVTLSDLNGSVAGTTSIVNNTGNNAAINDAASSMSLSGTYTVTFSSAVSSGATITLGTVSIDPDVAGVYTVSLDGNDAAGTAIQSATKTFKAQAYETLNPTASVVQSAAFGTGVDIDADGNVYWADLSGSAIYKTDAITNVTSRFASPSGPIKLFVDGSYLFVMSDLGKISKIPLSNTNNAATGTVVRQHTSKSTTYAQTQGYFRISGKNYISYNIGHSGELWQYDDPQDTAPTYRSITSNEATLEFASHPFKVGDTVTVENVATAFNGTFTVSSVSATSITYAKTNANIARVATTGNVYNSNSTMLSANINGNGNAIRGMAPSLDNSKIYFADPTKKILKYDFSNGQITAAASLVGINYAPDDVALLGDGSFIMSAFGTGGYLWHVANDGTPLQRIRVFTSTTISNGYDLRIAPDGSAIYLAAQSSGFLKIPLNPPLAGRNYGVSTAIEPPAGTPKVVTNTPANVVSTSVDNVSFSSADMKGSVNANGTTSTAYFKYSTSPEFPSGSTVTTSSTAVTGSSDTPITKSINTLTPATTYYYKLVVETGSTLVEGAVRSFATLTPPSVTSATVTAGPAIGGTAVTLTGQGLATPTSVKVGNTVLNTFTASSTQVQLTTPPQTGTNISVTTSNGVAVSTFNYDSPTVVSVSSATGVAGDRLTLRGLNLTGVTGVTVNGVTMSGLTFVSDTEVSALVPSGTGTNLNIVLSTPSGSVTKAAAFSYSQTPQQSNGSGPSLQLSTPIVTGANKKYLFTKQAYTVTLIGTNMSSLFSLNVANRLATLVSSTSNSATIQIRKQIRPGVYDLQANYAAGQSVISGAFEFFEKPNAVYRRNDSDSDLKYVVNRAKSILKTNKAITKLICVSRPAVSGMNAARRFDTKKLGASCSELAKLLPDPKQLVVIRAGVKAAALPRGSLYISFE